MAWIDDRIWCHPKLTDVSKGARWGYVAGVCYSTGFQTGGRLTDGQVRALGVSGRERGELVAAGLWHDDDGGVVVHDWDHHNSRRDVRRANDRERKRRQRERDSPGDVTRPSRVTSAVTARVDGSEGSDGSDKDKSNPLRRRAPRARDELWDTLVDIFGAEANGDLERGRWNKALKSMRQSDATPESLRVAAANYRQQFPEAAMTALALAGNWTTLTATAQTTQELDERRERERITRIRHEETERWPTQSGT